MSKFKFGDKVVVRKPTTEAEQKRNYWIDSLMDHYVGVHVVHSECEEGVYLQFEAPQARSQYFVGWDLIAHADTPKSPQEPSDDTARLTDYLKRMITLRTEIHAARSTATEKEEELRQLKAQSEELYLKLARDK